jgi:NADPH:quinone reductase-like Zn-dependent oxidoreductase
MAASLRKLVDHLAAGQIKPPVQEKMSLAEAAKAHRLLESGGVRGKVVLVP